VDKQKRIILSRVKLQCRMCVQATFVVESFTATLVMLKSSTGRELVKSNAALYLKHFSGMYSR